MAPALLLGGSGDFGTSPIYGQLSGKQLLAYVCVCGVPGMRYNNSLRIKFRKLGQAGASISHMTMARGQN
jgi:hypothetical protein